MKTVKLLAFTLSVTLIAIDVMVTNVTGPPFSSRIAYATHAIHAILYHAIPAYRIFPAPLDDCSKYAIPGAFMVKLQQNHSLADHSTAVGTDITPHLQWEYENTIFGVHSTFYHAENVDDKMLAAIRADPGVYRVFCDQLSPGMDLEFYTVPLRGCQHPVVPGEYVVRLRKHHSLKHHSEIIGTDIEPHLISTRVYNTVSSAVAYWAKDIDENMLSAIQADNGVLYIECNKASMPADRNIAMASLQPPPTLPYEAPLQGCNERAVSEEYGIKLYSGYSYEDHITAIGDVVGNNLVSINDLFYYNSTMYWVEGIEKQMLATIRADPGVHYVTCGRQGSTDSLQIRCRSTIREVWGWMQVTVPLTVFTFVITWWTLWIARKKKEQDSHSIITDLKQPSPQPSTSLPPLLPTYNLVNSTV
jgi:hypothetical protein